MDAVEEVTKRCGDHGGMTKAGKACASHLGLSEINGRCLAHDPLRRQEATAARRLGALAKAEKIRKQKAALPADVPRAPRTLEDAERVASWITRAVLIGEIDVRVAEASVKAVRQFALTIEKRVLQDRVRQLEKALKAAGA